MRAKIYIDRAAAAILGALGVRIPISIKPTVLHCGDESPSTN